MKTLLIIPIFLTSCAIFKEPVTPSGIGNRIQGNLYNADLTPVLDANKAPVTTKAVSTINDAVARIAVIEKWQSDLNKWKKDTLTKKLVYPSPAYYTILNGVMSPKNPGSTDTLIHPSAALSRYWPDDTDMAFSAPRDTAITWRMRIVYDSTKMQITRVGDSALFIKSPKKQ